MPKEFQMPNLGTQFLNLSDSIMGLIGHEWVNNVIWEQSADENKPNFISTSFTCTNLST